MGFIIIEAGYWLNKISGFLYPRQHEHHYSKTPYTEEVGEQTLSCILNPHLVGAKLWISGRE